jgi:mannose-6-phosphate isomerase-like protein (cupin superfamily)
LETAREQAKRVPDEPFVNDAGSITNIAFGKFECVSLILSNTGAWRSKHYHLTDSHVLYVLEGEMWYWERDLDGEYPLEPVVVKRGESVFTGPMVAHQTYFPKFTRLISCSAKPRDTQSHEADVVRVEEPWQTIGR